MSNATTSGKQCLVRGHHQGFHLQSVFDFSANLGRAGGVDWYSGSLLHCF